MSPVPPSNPREIVYKNLGQFENLLELEKRFQAIPNQQTKWKRTVAICSIAIGIIGGTVYRLAYQSTYKYAALGVGSALFLVSLVISRIIRPSPYAQFMNSFKDAALEIRTARDYKCKAVCASLIRQKKMVPNKYLQVINAFAFQYNTNPTSKDAFDKFLNPQEKTWRVASTAMFSAIQKIAQLKDREIDRLPTELNSVVKKVRIEALYFIHGGNPGIDGGKNLEYVHVTLGNVVDQNGQYFIDSADPWSPPTWSF